MGTGILVCGLNGSGKSSVGEVLAEKLGFHFIDDENLLFPQTDTNNIYASPRSRKEAETFLLREIRAYKQFLEHLVVLHTGKMIRSLFHSFL